MQIRKKRKKKKPKKISIAFILCDGHDTTQHKHDKLNGIVSDLLPSCPRTKTDRRMERERRLKADGKRRRKGRETRSGNFKKRSKLVLYFR